MTLTQKQINAVETLTALPYQKFESKKHGISIFGFADSLGQVSLYFKNGWVYKSTNILARSTRLPKEWVEPLAIILKEVK